MKKRLNILLVFALVLSMLTPAFAFAADTELTVEQKFEALKKAGIMEGNADGEADLEGTMTRGQLAKVLANTYGLELLPGEAVEGFDEPTDSEFYVKGYIQAVVKAGFMEGGPKADGTTGFRPNDEVTLQELAMVLGRTLGLELDETATVGGKTSKWATASVAAAIEAGLLVEADNYTSNAKRSDLVVGAYATYQAYLAETGLTVTEVKAASAKSFVVKFNRAVADTDAVTFAVKRSSTDVAVTTTWNEAKTEATLASSSNFAEATFTVEVKAGDEVLKTENITITAQKVAKIEFTSKNVSVHLSSGKGFVTYKVFDQYNNDITTNYLANNMTFQSGAGTVVGKDGVITITPAVGQQLIQFPNISVVVYDTTSGVSATATLPTATAVGTLSSFELGSVENVKLVEGDVTSVFYIPFTAKDTSGNETKDYELVTGGLIFSSGQNLVVSIPNVTAQIVRDPANSKLAAVEVKVVNGSPLAMDMPVTITAMTYAGTTSSVQTTLVKAKVLHTLNLFAPSATVAVNESPELGFEAFDQFGNKITRYADIFNKVSLTNVTLSKKVDGTAKFTMDPVGTKGITQLTAVVGASGKMSTVTINVQDAAKPARLAIDSTKVVSAMEHTATQIINFNGQAPGGITIYDQYDRVMSPTAVNTHFASGSAYKVVVSNQSGSVGLSTPGTVTVDLNTATNVSLVANAATGGSDTIKFELKDVVANKVLSTGALSLSVIKTSDIVDYTVTAFEEPIYASVTTNTAQEQAYAAYVEVFGKTNSGAKVLLAGTPVVSTSVENSADFRVLNGAGAWDSVAITANKLTAPKTTAETVVSVNLFHNGRVNALTTKLTSSSVAPTATTIVSRGTAEDKITLTVAQFNALVGESVALYNASGASTTTADFYFRVTDSYGTFGMIPANFNVDAQNATTGAAGTSVLTLGADGTVSAANGVAGEKVYVTAITNNGLTKTVEVTIVP